MGNRKQDHLNFTEKSRLNLPAQDDRFYYEPLLSAHPNREKNSSCELKDRFLGREMGAPIWISSMTGGTGEAQKINENLARVCADFKLGMGVGSCRSLLDEQKKERFNDFNLRPILGADRPFFANLGICQIEELLLKGEEEKIFKMIDRLKASGLIIHVNPLQEWLQPEGDRLLRPPIEIIAQFLEKFSGEVIVKEVGQGFGPESMKALLNLPIAAIDFAAYGGTNFSQIELMRNKEQAGDHSLVMAPFMNVGHNINEMISYLQKIEKSFLNSKIEFILSGGIQHFLDGYYALEKIKVVQKREAVYGMGGALLSYARNSYESLRAFMEQHIQGLRFAQKFLKIKEKEDERR